ncbi:MAG: bifunctional [glutamine synthetase] adenylyltransferase/[glutamine synthetase]-adenylyl-L-tyrosine phosphorylase [Robiginitomaculum sp.]|nr:bifunctional [glutamine synthetase] adenylyltransferase/[glutamine synthetase]-adenylyl-L-tyrosine phosphorylase [Robiginitomaculum sp.]
MIEGDPNVLFEQRIGKALPVFDAETGAVKLAGRGLDNIVASAASCAPYLERLLDKWPEIVTSLKQYPPEEIFTGLLEGIKPTSLPELHKSLRQTKQKIHLLAALCDLAGVWDWVQVCQVLSEFADKSMQALITTIAEDMEFDGTPDNPVPGLFVLALGKYGARELNYSSDIDLIVFYDPERVKLPNPERAERTLIRFVRKLMRGFDDVSEHGYVFRTDLRLRPDPRATTVAVSTRTAERYYESLGQNWERAAMIKARAVGGDKQAAADFMKHVLTPFVWRRSMDFHAIDDVHSIKRQIQGNAKPEDIVTAGHDVKLGVGGIREIEFFVQVQQLILGGRNPKLWIPRTVDGLQALAEGGFADPDNARILQEKYADLRCAEHRVQMYADAQSHTWPIDKTQRQQLAALSGFGDFEEFETKLKNTFLNVHKIYRELFAGEEDLSTEKGSLVFTGVEPEAITLQTFDAYGFERGGEIWHIMADWLGGRMPATRTERARELLTRLAPRIIEACGATGVADTAFYSFAEFATKLNAGVTLFSLFLNQPTALTSLIDMLAIAPKLAAQLAERPALLDALTDPNFFNIEMQITPDSYRDLIAPDADFEIAMNSVRRAVHEDQFMFTARVLRGANIARAGEILSDIAEATIGALLPRAAKEIERVYGPIEGDYAVLGLGKLGGRELSLKSDLDIMLVYEDDAGGVSGKYNKLTRRLITALSSFTAEGTLYEVDMALRPSGRAGPLAVSVSAFEKYYREDAWTWEFMALSRGRVIAASSNAFELKLESIATNTLFAKNHEHDLAKDVLDMHQRLTEEKPGFGLWDIKNTGGGLRDIEFIAQFLMLKHKPEQMPHGTKDMLIKAHAENWIQRADADMLLNTTKLYHALQQVIAVTISGNFDPDEAPETVKTLLVSATKNRTFAVLEKTYIDACAGTSEIFGRIIK